MEKDYGLVKYETTPAVLTEKGDSVMVTVKGTFPESISARPQSCTGSPS